MSFNIFFSGSSPGKGFSESRNKLRLGESFPSSKAIDHLKSTAIGSVRTLAGDPTSTNSGSATIALAQGVGALQLTRILKESIAIRMIAGEGSMRVHVKKKGWFIDDTNARNFILSRSMADDELIEMVKFLGNNDLNAMGPYSALIKVFGRFSTKCANGRFLCMAEFEL